MSDWQETLLGILIIVAYVSVFVLIVTVLVGCTPEPASFLPCDVKACPTGVGLVAGGG